MFWIFDGADMCCVVVVGKLDMTTQVANGVISNLMPGVKA